MLDAELLEKFQSNPEQALGDTIERYAGMVYSIIYGKICTVGTEEDVKECVSDVFLEFYRQIDRFHPEKGSVKTYLSMMAKYKGIDLYRKLIRIAGNQSVIDNDLEEFADTKANPEQDIIRKEEKELLLQAINTLGEPDKEIFIRKYYMCQKTKEIAEALNLQDNTVDKKVSRGLKKLRILLGGVQDGKEDNLLAK